MHELCSSVGTRWSSAVNLHVASVMKDEMHQSTYRIEEGPGEASYATAIAQRAGTTAADLKTLIAAKKK